MRTCPICGTRFEERAYQVAIRGVGSFDTFGCAEEALRKERRRRELPDDLLAALRPNEREIKQPRADLGPSVG